MTIREWLNQATAILNDAGIPSSRLDAEIILAHTLRRSRTFLHAHDDDMLDPRQREIADARLTLREDRTPIAYIIGHKEFYGRTFRVSPSVLIPRPESEVIIHLLKSYVKSHNVQDIVDVGTGSGCLGITAKLEHPQAHVTLIDTSRHALTVAKQNAAHQRAEVIFMHSSLLNDYPEEADVVIANLPYVDREWERSPETNHEPPEALFASNNGMQLIDELITQLPRHLKKDGIALIEADETQHAQIIEHAAEYGLLHDQTEGLIVQLRRP
ncbi:MAG TPA: peptide chain release factor N(5)-glutamine methyltransferase [Candidatus Saccharimonadales bacterium]|nr:peptide chain release factor N(5)-glutamine methyltransferase [Candidatus Saccharimonadales bacterium]